MRISLYRTQPLTTTAKMPIHSSMFHLGQQTFFGRTELSKFVLAIMTKVSNRKKENETDTILMGEKCFYASGSSLYRHISLPTLSHFRQFPSNFLLHESIIRDFNCHRKCRLIFFSLLPQSDYILKKKSVRTDLSIEQGFK